MILIPIYAFQIKLYAELCHPFSGSAIEKSEPLPPEILPVCRQALLEASYQKANCPAVYADAFAITATQVNDGVLATGETEFVAVKDLFRIEGIGERSSSI